MDRTPFNFNISNIPGSRTPLYCGGANVVSQYPVNVLVDGVGISITLLSYESRLDFGITADRELAPDVWTLRNEMLDELDALARVMPAREPSPGMTD